MVLIIVSLLLYIFVVLLACEGSFGLPILVSLFRSHGNDNFPTYSVLQC